MKVLLVNPPGPTGQVVNRDVMGGYGMISPTGHSLLPPMVLVSGAGMLLKNGMDVEIVDCLDVDMDVPGIVEKSKIGYDLIMVYVAFASYQTDVSCAEAIKHACPSSLVGLVGPYLSQISMKIMKTRQVDFIAEGEIESVFLHVPANPTRAQLQELKGTVWKIGGKVVKNPPAERIMNIDSLPMPARHLLKNKKYYVQYLKKKPLATIQTSRGCPYWCHYCPYPVAQGGQWRFHSPERVLQELKDIVSLGFKAVQFRDPIFSVNKDRVKKICTGMIDQHIKIDWWCETRADCLDEPLVELMAKSGCKGISMGVETADEEVAKKINRRLATEQTRKIIKVCRKNKIQVFAFFILGNPGETLETIHKTINLAVELDPDRAQFTVPMPFAGTKLAEIYEAKYGPIDFGNQDLVYVPDGLTREQLLQLQKYAERKFYLRPKQIMREIKIIRSRTGIKKAVSFARNAMKN